MFKYKAPDGQVNLSFEGTKKTEIRIINYNYDEHKYYCIYKNGHYNLKDTFDAKHRPIEGIHPEDLMLTDQVFTMLKNYVLRSEALKNND